jgi:hypothetical protein
MAWRKQPTAEQSARAEVRRSQFRSLAEQIAQMDDAQRLAMAAQMSAVVTVEGRALSLHNSCLVACQKPDATVLGGFGQWIKAGRCVRKGEHGLMIWAPTMRRTQDPDAEQASDTTPRRAGFIMVTVFDVSQTEESA